MQHQIVVICTCKHAHIGLACHKKLDTMHTPGVLGIQTIITSQVKTSTGKMRYRHQGSILLAIEMQ